MITIETKDLVKKYGDKTVVNKINFKIERGELFSLLGVNGAGKTTTIKMLTGLIKKTDGKAYINGMDIDKDIEKIKEIINVSPQETAIAPNLSVKENLEFICEIYKVKNVNEKVNELIEIFSLEEVKNQRTKTLSGGWQRRLSIAMALVNDPQIIFLDEPTLGLDVLAKRELWKIIEKLKKEKTIVLTTHYMEEAEMLSDKVGIMYKGVLIDFGTVKELNKIAGTKTLEDAFVTIIERKKNENN